MSELQSSTKWNKLKTIVAIGVPSLMLNSCAVGYASDKQFSASERYDNDYTTFYFNNKADSDCLKDTPYDDNNGAMILESGNEIIVTPVSYRFDALTFTGLDQAEKPLMPVGEFTEAVILTYGCKYQLSSYK